MSPVTEVVIAITCIIHSVVAFVALIVYIARG